MTTGFNIVHCLRAPVGGLFRHVCDLAKEQAARGHAVGILADTRTGGTVAERRLGELASVCRLGIARVPMGRLPGAGDVAATRELVRRARAWKADILHGHGAKGGAYARLAGAWIGGAGPLRVYTPHGGSLHYSPGTIAGFLFLGLERLLLRRTDLLLFESDYGRQAFADKVGDPACVSRVVHNGLAPAEFEPVETKPDAADFVFVGELRTLKGVDVLLHALAALNADATAVIFGEGAQEPELKRLAADLGVADRVRFAGAAPARAAFARGRCLVVPSRAESLPYIVLEGAAAGLPVIATNVGGIPEIFAGREERLLPPGDAPALAAAMSRLRADPAGAREEARLICEEVARRFSVAAMTDSVIDAYVEARNRRALKPS